MIPLHHAPHFTFRFADDRINPRFHREGVEAGRRVDVKEPIIVRAGDAFVAIPGERLDA